ncbi:hypothetical protein DPMN_062205 [Dreissena polymorpha]|uniref:Uncharacterized protein n=1 Tax=Dreissena polymorpha TaxID=45954 RepID=A0A9D4HJ57_DREPO|nr:hypothetical protein DPMN_062205 [Dreissena polymorpha]
MMYTASQCINTVVPGPYTAIPEPHTAATTDHPGWGYHHGSIELSKTAVLASRSAKDIPGRPRTYTDRHGATRRLHGSHAGSSRI